jgi:hypothetical protein
MSVIQVSTYLRTQNFIYWSSNIQNMLLSYHRQHKNIQHTHAQTFPVSGLNNPPPIFTGSGATTLARAWSARIEDVRTYTEWQGQTDSGEDEVPK